MIKKEYIPFTVYDRSRLFPDAQFNGPAIIEERESTIVVGEDATIRVDDFGFIWIDIIKGSGTDSNDKDYADQDVKGGQN